MHILIIKRDYYKVVVVREASLYISLSLYEAPSVERANPTKSGFEILASEVSYSRANSLVLWGRIQQNALSRYLHLNIC